MMFFQRHKRDLGETRWGGGEGRRALGDSVGVMENRRKRRKRRKRVREQPTL